MPSPGSNPRNPADDGALPKPAAPAPSASDVPTLHDSVPEIGSNPAASGGDLQHTLSTRATFQSEPAATPGEDPGIEDTGVHFASVMDTQREEDSDITRMLDHARQGAASKAPADAGCTAMIEAGLLEPAPPEASSRGVLALLDQRYELMRKIGEGGMGIVYLAYDRQGQCPVAVKLLSIKHLADASAKQKFMAEAKQMHRMPSHAGVLVVKALGSEARPYYAMEYMPNGSLGSLVRSKGPLERNQILRLILPVSRAIEYLHVTTGQMHRDIKPENILLAEDGSARLSDFGLIRAVGMGARGLRAGTIAYMPPEALLGKSRNVGFEWDIYSLGATLYEMLTGQPPYAEQLGSRSEARDPQTIIAHIAKAQPKPIRELQRGADAALALVADWAMSREARDRYVRISDLVADLDRIASGQRPLGPRQVAGGTPWARAIAGILLLASALAAGWYFDLPGIVSKQLAAPAQAPSSSNNAQPPQPAQAQQPGGTQRSKPAAVATASPAPALIAQSHPSPPWKLEIEAEPALASYAEGQTISFKLRSEQEAFVYVFMASLDHEDEVVMLHPMPRLTPDALVKPGQVLSLPSEEAKREGVVLRIHAPHGRVLVKVIASKQPLDWLPASTAADDLIRTFRREQMRVRVAGREAAGLSQVLEPTQWSSAELMFTTVAGSSPAAN